MSRFARSRPLSSSLSPPRPHGGAQRKVRQP